MLLKKCRNDLAVITLSQFIPMSGSANSVCLPNQGQCLGVGTSTATAGYGRTSGGGSISLRLKEVCEKSP